MEDGRGPADRTPHICEHAEWTHQCRCGLERAHTPLEFLNWAAEQDLRPLDSEVK